MTKEEKEYALWALEQIERLIIDCGKDHWYIEELRRQAKEKREMDVVLQTYDLEKKNKETDIKLKCSREQILKNIWSGAYD